MTESEVVRELSVRTGLPESATAMVFREVRALVRSGVLDDRALREPDAVVEPPAPAASPDPKDPGLVEELIARAKRHPLGLEFLLSGMLGAVAIVLGAHAFTIEAARARLRREQAEKPEEAAVEA